ncbi:hypothetical protein IE81DRAFT_319082 [Ceraceosorus guamensis]|uniref:IMD domain-containing protein n=1 Tax=Ceraceosorus guamensis TaxID=1522189 RepID=A0A316WC48_9BASI|nr:hypothetical protein IE81DRAFT_319082 [Ceraceosorus guamensis]PWN46211.1 hypothetical protein IE81DRAFT_319082 [Ceraceosorus guamensis]
MAGPSDLRRRAFMPGIAAAPGGPPSPTLSATTHASTAFAGQDSSLRPRLVVTRADMRASLSAYDELLQASKAYTSAMLAMSHASAGMAAAMETCSRVKGAHEAGSGLQAAAGLHHLLANSQSLLADVLWRDFSIPLLEHYDAYRAGTADRQVAHEAEIRAKSKILGETEARNMRTGRRKERDLNSFRRALAELQSQVDALDEVKSSYYHEVLEGEEEVWGFIHQKIAHLLRSQLEIHERISSKGLSDPVLENMLSTVPDPFSAYGPAKTEDQIFSVLAPGSLGMVQGTESESENEVGAALAAGLRSPNLLSPSTPAKGLPRGISAARSKKEETSSASPEGVSAGIAQPVGLGLVADQLANRGGATGPQVADAEDGDLFDKDETELDDNADVDIFGGAVSPRAYAQAQHAHSTSIATRLKHSLSIIEETSAGGPKGATPVGSEAGGEGTKQSESDDNSAATADNSFQK